MLRPSDCARSTALWQGPTLSVRKIESYLAQQHAKMARQDAFFDNKVGFWVTSLAPFVASLKASKVPYLMSKERARRAMYVSLPGGLIVQLIEGAVPPP